MAQGLKPSARPRITAMAGSESSARETFPTSGNDTDPGDQTSGVDVCATPAVIPRCGPKGGSVWGIAPGTARNRRADQAAPDNEQKKTCSPHGNPSSV